MLLPQDDQYDEREIALLLLLYISCMIFEGITKIKPSSENGRDQHEEHGVIELYQKKSQVWGKQFLKSTVCERDILQDATEPKIAKPFQHPN